MLNFNPKYTNQNDKNIILNLNKNVIINKKLFGEINIIKSNIDDIETSKWKLIRTIVTEYEFIGNNRYHNIQQLKNRRCISRAYYKLWEILCIYEKDFKLFENRNTPMRFAGLAEAPGGFIQCLVDYRQNKKDDLTGISLRDCKENKIDWKSNWLMENKNIKLIFGDEKKGHDGNLYNPDIINYYCNYYKNKKANLVTSDGGFLLHEMEENHKGQYHNQLFLCETLIALRILKNEGHFIMKNYDICNKGMLDIIIILNKVFKKVDVMKPVTSREMNNENYIVCIGYKKSNVIINEITKMIEHMWKNKNQLIIDSIFDDNKSPYKYVRQSKQKLLYQKQKLTEGVSLKNKSIGELKQIIKDNHKNKSKSAYDWLRNNFLY